MTSQKVGARPKLKIRRFIFVPLSPEKFIGVLVALAAGTLGWYFITESSAATNPTPSPAGVETRQEKSVNGQ